MALVKKVHFLWLFVAIKFELSLVITFMAFHDCVRTLLIVLYDNQIILKHYYLLQKNISMFGQLYQQNHIM